MTAAEPDRLLWLVDKMNDGLCALARRHRDDAETLELIRQMQTAVHAVYMIATPEAAKGEWHERMQQMRRRRTYKHDWQSLRTGRTAHNTVPVLRVPAKT